MQWTPGSTVSAVGHTALLIWLIGGWGFQADPMPFEVSDVSIVTSEEYAAIVSATTPNPSDVAPDAPVAPPAEQTPDTPTPDEVPPPPPPPPPPEPPVAEAPPPPAPDALPVPPETQAPVAPGPVQDEVVAAPNLNDAPRAIPRPSTRVMAQPVAPPPPDATPDEVVRQQAAPEAAPDAPVVEEAQEETAPEEAVTEIVTEAETPTGRVTEAPRPPQRPNRPTPAPEPEVEVAEETPAPAPEPEPDPAPQTDEDAIAAALAAAAAVTAPEPDLAPGPPMTGAEQEGFRVAVNACWNVDPGSQAAMVTMTVAFDLDQSGRVTGDVRQVGAMGGDAAATEIAYQAARRAILRCQGQDGYDLPAEKYDQWREVEITFDPSGMRLR
ncbi:hypothetical protein LGQ03_12675 [Loktanella sp. TSTF-M6]|uniref:Cell division and transport-associated protein TolA n=1 Tax=Loktanella gaetbuli TaxID=2881335 RepID=A0ABS8BWH7_9RHOB|nr:hypothetical protein [Loktanella gaetbuli]MCB5200096.1 hypothetical protein [Loktanella gaetbuli]